jgi:hypothetical protein
VNERRARENSREHPPTNSIFLPFGLFFFQLLSRHVETVADITGTEASSVYAALISGSLESLVI